MKACAFVWLGGGVPNGGKVIAATWSDQSSGPWWKIVLRIALACAAIGTLVVIASVVLTMLALVFSDNAKIQANLRDAAAKGLITTSGFEFSPYGHRFHSYDLATDCVGFMVNLSNDEDGILRRTAETSTWKLDHYGCDILIKGLADNKAAPNETYIRYWHGYQVYLRPLLTIMPLDYVRRITAALLYGVMIFFTWRLARWFGPWAWPVTLLPFLIVSDFLTVPLVTTHALQLVFVFLSAAVVPVIMDRVTNPRAFVLPVSIFAAGMISSFFSFLMNPPLAATLIGFLAIAKDPGRTMRETALNLLYAAALIALWFAGYFGEWIAKWIVAVPIVGVDAVVHDIKGRAGVYDQFMLDQHVGLFDATKINLYQFGLRGYILLAMLASAAVLAVMAVMKRLTVQAAIGFAAMLTPLATIVIWAETNPAHSIIHNGFVSRSFVLFIVIPLLAAMLTWRAAFRPNPV